MSAEVSLGWNNAKLQAGARGAEAIVQRTAGGMRDTLNKVGSGFTFGAGIAAFDAIKDSVQNSIGYVAQATVEYDSLRLGMVALEGSIGGANERLAEMQRLAKSPGLGFEQAVDADIKLRSVGLSASLSAKTIEEMGNALAVVGKGKADLDGVLLAITQIVSKGKVSAEELNQIAERVPQIRKVLKDTFGTADSQELQKLGVPVERFIKLTVDGFSRTIPRAITGLQGRWDNATDAMKARTADFGTAITENMVDPLGELTEVLEENAVQFKAAGAAIGSGLQTAGTVIGGFTSAVFYCVDGVGQLTEDTLRLAFGVEKDVEALRKAEVAAVQLQDAQAELSRNAKDLKRHQEEAAEATKNWADEQLKAKERALELSRAQGEVAKKAAAATEAARGGFIDQRQTTSGRYLSDEAKLAQAKEKVLQIERDLSKTVGQKGGEEITYKLLQEREKTMGEILELSKSISAQAETEKASLEQKAEASAKLAAERQQALTLLDAELSILEAQAAGQNKKAAAMERARDIAEETLRIIESTGLAQDEAVRKATALVDRKNKSNQGQRQPGDPFNGFSFEGSGGQEGARQRAVDRAAEGEARRKGAYDRSFGGLKQYDEKQKTSLRDSFKFSSLDAYQRLQDRSRPVGAPLPAANGKPQNGQELPTVEQLLKQLITTTEGLKEG